MFLPLKSTLNRSVWTDFQNHLKSYVLPRIEAWCSEYRITNQLPTSNNNTNNLVEWSFRYTKELQLNRHKAYNLCDLLLLLLDNSEFYQNKCVDAGNNVLESWLRNCHSKYVIGLHMHTREGVGQKDYTMIRKIKDSECS